MKKAAIAMSALPLLCLVAGYGTGMLLAPQARLAAVQSSTDSAAVRDGTPDAAPPAQIAAEPTALQHETSAGLDPYALAEDRKIVRVGQMTIPVQKTHSVTYVVADFALKLETLDLAERYRRVEDATRLRDSLLLAMNLAAEGAVLRGAAIDSDALSRQLLDLIGRDHAGIDDVMFVTLYKQDVARL